MSDGLQVLNSGAGNSRWFVADAKGKPLKGCVSSREIAERQIDEMRREAQRKTRSCMTCGTSFRSEGNHNRMCDRCRSSAYDLNPVGFETRRGKVRAEI